MAGTSHDGLRSPSDEVILTPYGDANDRFQTPEIDPNLVSISSSRWYLSTCLPEIFSPPPPPSTWAPDLDMRSGAPLQKFGSAVTTSHEGAGIGCHLFVVMVHLLLV